MAMRDKIEHAIQNQPCTVKDLKAKFRLLLCISHFMCSTPEKAEIHLYSQKGYILGDNFRHAY
mgnify:CR=1 FL=1